MTSYNNACACNRFHPLGYFMLYRTSSSMQLTADLPRRKNPKTPVGKSQRKMRARSQGWRQHHPQQVVVMAPLCPWCLNKQKPKHFWHFCLGRELP